MRQCRFNYIDCSYYVHALILIALRLSSYTFTTTIPTKILMSIAATKDGNVIDP